MCALLRHVSFKIQQTPRCPWPTPASGAEGQGPVSVRSLAARATCDGNGGVVDPRLPDDRSEPASEMTRDWSSGAPRRPRATPTSISGGVCVRELGAIIVKKKEAQGQRSGSVRRRRAGVKHAERWVAGSRVSGFLNVYMSKPVWTGTCTAPFRRNVMTNWKWFSAYV